MEETKVQPATGQVTEQPQAQAAAEQTAIQSELANMVAQVDKYLELAKASGNAEAVECLTFFKKVGTECAGITDETAIGQLTAALAATEAAKLKALGKDVPAWLTAMQALAQAKLDGRSDDEAAQEAVFEGLLARLAEGTSEGAKERLRPILAEHVKAQLPKDEPVPAFLDRDIQQGEEVLEQQAVKAAQAAKAAGLSESSAIAAQRIVLTEDRAKIRSALADIKEYDSAKGAADHQVEVVRSYVIATGNGGSSRASEPLFSDEFVETCGNIAKVALGTAVVVGTAYLAYQGAKAAYEWFTE